MHDEYFGTVIKRDELKKLLRQKIIDGVYRPGDKLPSENEMVVKHGLCRNTIREAIASLVHEGLLVRSQGKGTFVAERKSGPLTFALVAPRLWQDENGVADQLFTRIDAEARANGAAVLVYLDQDNLARERENLLDVLNRRVDGLILLYMGGERNRDVLDRICQAGIPVAMVDRYVPGLDLDHVATDNTEGACLLTERLLSTGINRVYHFTLAEDCAISAVTDRAVGYEQVMRSHGLECDLLYCIESAIEYERPWVFEGAYRVARAMELPETEPFAVFAVTGTLVEPIVRAFDERGIPHDRFTLATFDEPYREIASDIRLVKATQPLLDMGSWSVRLLMERLAGSKEVRRVTLPPEISANF